MNFWWLIRVAAILIAFMGISRADDAGDFATACRELAASGEGLTIRGGDGWLYLRAELAHLGKGAFWGDSAQNVSMASQADRRDPLPAITKYSQALTQVGIDLLFVPVPPKAVIYPEPVTEISLPKFPSRLDIAHEEFYEILHSNEVRVLDLGPVYAAERSAANNLYCRTDTHWSGSGCVIAAREIAARIKVMDWYESVPKQEFEAEWRTITIDGDLRGDTAKEKETIAVRFIGRRSGSELHPLEVDPLSAVLLMADSHGLVFHAGREMYGVGAGLADQLAYELGFSVALIGVRGSGASPARITLFRKSRKDPELLATKKVVVWCLTAREFTETDGWMEVPVKR